MPYHIRTIVAGIATVDEQDPVLAPSIEIAEHTGATLHLVHAFELPDTVIGKSPWMRQVDSGALQDYSDRMQARLEVQARALTSNPRVHCHALLGPAAALIQDAAQLEGADLIILGAARRVTAATSILGSTAERVLRGAKSPLLVLRAAPSREARNVLIATDLTPFSDAVHEIGLDIVETVFHAERAELRSLLVACGRTETPPAPHRTAMQERARVELNTFLRLRRGRNRPLSGAVRCGDPATEIRAEAEDWRADLLIVGTHGRAGPERWLLRSVAEASIRGARCPVLIVPDAAARRRSVPVRVTGSTAARALPVHLSV